MTGGTCIFMDEIPLLFVDTVQPPFKYFNYKKGYLSFNSFAN